MTGHILKYPKLSITEETGWCRNTNDISVSLVSWLIGKEYVKKRIVWEVRNSSIQNSKYYGKTLERRDMDAGDDSQDVPAVSKQFTMSPKPQVGTGNEVVKVSYRSSSTKEEVWINYTPGRVILYT